MRTHQLVPRQPPSQLSGLHGHVLAMPSSFPRAEMYGRQGEEGIFGGAFSGICFHKFKIGPPSQHFEPHSPPQLKSHSYAQLIHQCTRIGRRQGHRN